MKLYAPLLAAVLLAVPAVAQTDSSAQDNDNEMTTRVGSAFYTDDTYVTLRPAEELQTNWGTLSAEDQTALRARCEEVKNAASEMEPSKGADATAGGTEAAAAEDGGTTTAEDMGFMADDTKIRPLCDAIATY